MHVKSSDLVHVMHSPESPPESEQPQIAFAGRSNVGKSSLINALLSRKKLALTSSTPGKTRNIYFYQVNGSFLFADLPGYGYAQIAQGQRRFFRVMVDAYFGQPDRVKGCILLLDPRRPVGPEELDFLNFLSFQRIPAIVVLTKWDRVKGAVRVRTRRDRETELAGTGARILTISSKNREGVAALWKHLEALLPQTEKKPTSPTESQD